MRLCAARVVQGCEFGSHSRFTHTPVNTAVLAVYANGHSSNVRRPHTERCLVPPLALAGTTGPRGSQIEISAAVVSTYSKRAKIIYDSVNCWETHLRRISQFLLEPHKIYFKKLGAAPAQSYGLSSLIRFECAIQHS